jgi:hypothetical protein
LPGMKVLSWYSGWQLRRASMQSAKRKEGSSNNDSNTRTLHLQQQGSTLPTDKYNSSMSMISEVLSHWEWQVSDLLHSRNYVYWTMNSAIYCIHKCTPNDIYYLDELVWWRWISSST